MTNARRAACARRAVFTGRTCIFQKMGYYIGEKRSRPSFSSSERRTRSTEQNLRRSGRQRKEGFYYDKDRHRFRILGRR